MEEEEISITDISTIDLQQKIDDLYDSFLYARLEDRKSIRKKYKELISEYNKRAGFEAYKTTI